MSLPVGIAETNELSQDSGCRKRRLTDIIDNSDDLHGAKRLHTLPADTPDSLNGDEMSALLYETVGMVAAQMAEAPESAAALLRHIRSMYASDPTRYWMYCFVDKAMPACRGVFRVERRRAQWLRCGPEREQEYVPDAAGACGSQQVNGQLPTTQLPTKQPPTRQPAAVPPNAKQPKAVPPIVKQPKAPPPALAPAMPPPADPPPADSLRRVLPPPADPPPTVARCARRSTRKRGSARASMSPPAATLPCRRAIPIPPTAPLPPPTVAPLPRSCLQSPPRARPPPLPPSPQSPRTARQAWRRAEVPRAPKADRLFEPLDGGRPLPRGWEQRLNPGAAPSRPFYFLDHASRRTTFDDPRAHRIAPSDPQVDFAL
eukprot:TRINITY_DN35692_c0_g1_i1.p1 TRINITY_DN35692_c0_g1~~TRINITY_DN35692_c0_g1_i1.p1  ORF type:complete len:391 (+),score=98.12 TRINITY_DN35692_c0_g1_i1:56-1174(+)